MNSVQTLQCLDLKEKLKGYQSPQGLVMSFAELCSLVPDSRLLDPKSPCCFTVFSLLNLKPPYGAHFLCTRSSQHANPKGGGREQQNILVQKSWKSALCFLFQTEAFPRVKNSAFLFPFSLLFSFGPYILLVWISD